MNNLRTAASWLLSQGFLLVFAVSPVLAGQSAKPNFTGIWKAVRITRGPVADSLLQIEQRESTVEVRTWIEKKPAAEWFIYPIDGKVFHTSGRYRIERTGHWEDKKLILESTGPGNLPWRRSTMRQVLSLSEDGRILTVSYHNPGDRNSEHDYRIESERVPR